MIAFFMALYAIIFPVLSNCLIFTVNSKLYFWLFIAVFLLLNIIAGMFVVNSRKVRLHFLCHGTTMLVSFCTTAPVSVIFHILVLLGAVQCEKRVLIYSIIYCVVCNIIIFVNGIVSVYLTSVQLGIKIRVLGVVCGFIPVANLFALGLIIKTTYDELVFENAKEKFNLARREEQLCKTKYPILFIHGVFFRDFKHLNYWGRIPSELEANGAVCYYGNHQSARAVKLSAEEIVKRINEIIDISGAEKVNIIAHSKGGLDCRYAMAHYGIADRVASITTVNTPHRGCLYAQWLLEIAPRGFKDTVAKAYNKTAKILGDAEPDFLAAVGDLTNEFCQEFDKNTPLPEGVFCQSIGSVMRSNSKGQLPMNLAYKFVRRFDGKNDGIVGIDSFKWGSKYTLLDMEIPSGISHADIIDLTRQNLKGFDVREFYVKLVNELKTMGY